MKRTIQYLAFALLAITISSCGEDNDDPTEEGAIINFTFDVNTSTTGISSGGRLEANSLTFNTGFITLTRIEFEAEVDDVDSVEVEIEQTIVIDFATGSTTPDLDNLVFPVGTYTEVEVELELLDVNDDPSVVLEGTFVDADDQEHPIRFEFNSGETFEVEKEGTIVMGAGTQVLAEVTFDPVAWFAEVTSAELSEASKNNDGVIVISETSNPDIFDTVADGLDLATEVEITL